MSQENVEIVRRLFEGAGTNADREGLVVDALNEDSVSTVLAALHPAVEFHEDARFPEAGIYRGVDACREYLRRFVESFDEFVWQAEDIIDLDEDRVLVPLCVITRGKGSGAAVEIAAGWIFTMRDGLVLKVEAFLDRADARGAAGLTE